MAKKSKQQSIPVQTKTNSVIVNKNNTNTGQKNNKFSLGNLYIIILLAIAFIVNANTINYKYAYDDDVFTTENSCIGIKRLGAIPLLFTHAKNFNLDKSNSGSYRPLLPITFAIEHEIVMFAIEHELFGLNPNDNKTAFIPAFSHTINLILFCVMLFMLFKFLQKIISNYAIYAVFLILLLYELHPLHTEVVANVKSRDEIMAFLFTLMSLLQTFKYIENNKIKNLILSGIYFFIAILTKENPVCFVAIVPLTLYFFTKTDLKKIIISTVPYLLMAACYVMLMNLFVDKGAKDAHAMITENALVGAANYGERLATALFIQLKYLGLLVVPYPLSFDYSYNHIPIVGLTNIWVILSFLVFAAMIVIAALGIKKKNIYSYCILFYVISLFITSNIIIEIGATAAERFLFIPSLAFCIALITLLSKVFKLDLSTLSFANSKIFSYILFAVATVYGIECMARNEVWYDNASLFKSGVESCPNSWRAEQCMAATYQKLAENEKTDLAKQKEYFKLSFDYFKKSIAIYAKRAETYQELGAAYFVANQFDSAEVYLKKAIVLKPSLFNAAANLGTIYMNRKMYPESIYCYRTSVTANPELVYAQFNLGACYYNVQKYDSAIIAFKKIIQIEPQYLNYKAVEYTATLYNLLGNADSTKKYSQMANDMRKGGK